MNNATSSFQCSELEFSLGRFLLGVHRKASPLRIRGELGLYPLVIDIIGTIIMYEKHLMSEKSSELLQNAYKQNSPASNSQPWVGKVHKLKKCIQTKHDIENKNRKSIIKTIRTSYAELWENTINNERKLRTYCKFKSNFEQEDYLSIRNRNKRKFITRLRISAHTLAIEKLRYSRPTIPADKRYCPTCPNEV